MEERQIKREHRVCRRPLDPQGLCGARLKMFSRCLVFIVYPKF
jgi:hypothetical protein